jgi:hypothetical protein
MARSSAQHGIEREERAMRKTIGLVLAAVAVAALWTTSAQASTTFHPRVGGALGLVPSLNSQDIATGAPVDAVYHGGPVMNGGATIHTIFWAPSGYHFDAGYEPLVQQFFTDAAHDSGGTTNVFSVLNQFGAQTGPDTALPGSYSISYSAGSDSTDDTDAYPAVADQCASPNGVTTCVTDGEVQAEIDAVAPSNERGLGNIWFVLLPPSVDECINAGECGSNAYAGYHSLMNLAGGLTIYGVIIDPLVEVVLAKGADPEGDPNAEATIDTVAHETVEAMTDPEGTGWMDPDGFEVGDKCEVGPQTGTPLGTAGPDNAPYNQVINGHKYLIQEMWSNDDRGCVQDTTLSSSPLPLPQVNLTQYSSTVSGEVGSKTAGVGVEVSLFRATPAGTAAAVAEHSTTTDAIGDWSLSLAPFAPGDDRDVIVVQYTGSPLAPDFIATGSGGNPLTESGWTGFFDLDTGFDVSNQAGGFVTLAPCFQTGVLGLQVGASQFTPTANCNTQTDSSTTPTGTISPSEVVTMSSNDNRGFLEPEPVMPSVDPTGNEAGALVDLTVRLGEPDALSSFLSPLAAVLPLGGPTGVASCTADLEAGTATCTGLVPGNSYSVARARGADTLSGVADPTGTVTVGPFSGPAPLTGGDALTLSNGSIALTTLHVAALVAKISGEETVLAPGSTCQQGLYYGPPLSTNPISTAAGLTGVGGASLTGEICPAGGSAAGLPTAAIEQSDDGSGGLTQTEVADIEDTSPIEGETVSGPFTALAEAGFPGPDSSVLASGDPVSLSITPVGGAHPDFTAANVNTVAGVPVSLAPGSYDATWTWSDSNGDSRTLTTRFVEQPSAPQGPTGPSGPPGPPGKVKVEVTVKCTVEHGDSKIVCVVEYGHSNRHGTLFMRIKRGTRIAGLGHARLRRGRAVVTVHARHAVAAGSWTVTLVRVGANGNAQTTTMTVHLR